MAYIPYESFTTQELESFDISNKCIAICPNCVYQIIKCIIKQCLVLLFRITLKNSLVLIFLCNKYRTVLSRCMHRLPCMLIYCSCIKSYSLDTKRVMNRYLFSISFLDHYKFNYNSKIKTKIICPYLLDNRIIIYRNSAIK